MSLEKELETFAKALPGSLSEQGKYILIQGESVAGIFDTYQDALKIGYESFGLTPFLVKQILAVEQVHCFSRDLAPCRT